MSLREALETFVASEPFERLLLAQRAADPGPGRGRRGLRRGGAGGRRWTSPILAVAPGPHEAEALAADLEAFLPGAVALLPGVGGAAVRGDLAGAGGAARRAAAIRDLRAAHGRIVLVAPVLAAMQGLIPTLGTMPALELVAGRDLAPDDLAERLVDLGYLRTDLVEHRGEFAVRGGVWTCSPASRGGRSGWSTGATRSRRCASSRPARSSRPRVSAPCTSGPVRELIPDDAVRAACRRRRPAGTRIGSPTSCNGSRTACIPRGWRPRRRSSSTTSRRRPSSCPTVRGSS